MDYVHFSAVKHGYADYAAQWPCSSFRRSVSLGLDPADWAGCGVDLAEAGEPG